jgi:hypothetical protein
MKFLYVRMKRQSGVGQKGESWTERRELERKERVRQR